MLSGRTTSLFYCSNVTLSIAFCMSWVNYIFTRTSLLVVVLVGDELTFVIFGSTGGMGKSAELLSSSFSLVEARN